MSLSCVQPDTVSASQNSCRMPHVYNGEHLLQRSGTQLLKVVQTFTRLTYQYLCWSLSLQQHQCNRVSRAQGLSAFLALCPQACCVGQAYNGECTRFTAQAVFMQCIRHIYIHPCSMAPSSIKIAWGPRQALPSTLGTKTSLTRLLL